VARTDADAVQEILRGNYDSDNSPALAPVIRTASLLVDRLASKDSTVSSATLKEIECYLAAHFYGHHDQFVQNKSTEGASGSFMGQTAMFFSSSQYGQTAMMLDPTGLLAELEQQAKGGVRRVGSYWLGTRYKNDESQTASDQ